MNYNIFKELRRAQGRTLESLARDIGSTRSLISKIERGEGNARIQVVEDLCEKLGAELRILIKD